MKRRRVLELVAGALLVFGGVANAGQEPALESTPERRAAVIAARTNLGNASDPVFDVTAVEVVGLVWNEMGTPVEYPQLQLRDLQDGMVVASTTGTVLGEFSFIGLSGGFYLIELVDDDDRVLAVGQALTVLPGETVSSFVIWVEGLTDQRFAVGGSSGTRRLDVVQAASDAQITGLGGGSNAASNEQ